MKTVPATLREATWLDEHGETVVVGDVLDGQTTVVVFMRHFG